MYTPSNTEIRYAVIIIIRCEYLHFYYERCKYWLLKVVLVTIAKIDSRVNVKRHISFDSALIIQFVALFMCRLQRIGRNKQKPEDHDYMYHLGCLCYSVPHVRIQRGGGQGSGPPEKSQNIGFLSTTGPDPLKNHKASKPASMLGHHPHSSEMFR